MESIDSSINSTCKEDTNLKSTSTAFSFMKTNQRSTKFNPASVKILLMVL